MQIQSLQFEIQDILLKRTQQLQSEAKCCKVDLKQSTKNEIPYLKWCACPFYFQNSHKTEDEPLATATSFHWFHLPFMR